MNLHIHRWPLQAIIHQSRLPQFFQRERRSHQVKKASDESPTALIKGRREPNCSNRKPNYKKFEPDCYQLTCCLQRWSTCVESHRQQGKGQYWHFWPRGHATGPTNGLEDSALLSGESSPGGAETPTVREDPVLVVSCFCAGRSRIVSKSTAGVELPADWSRTRFPLRPILRKGPTSFH